MWACVGTGQGNISNISTRPAPLAHGSLNERAREVRIHGSKNSCMNGQSYRTRNVIATDQPRRKLARLTPMTETTSFHRQTNFLPLPFSSRDMKK